MSTNNNHPDDYSIWQRLRSGEAQAIDAFMRKYYSDLYNYGLKLSMNSSLTKDCIQDLFVKLWQNREMLSEVTFVKTYLLKSLKRDLIKKMMKENRLTAYDDQAEPLEIVFSAEDLLISQQELLSQKAELAHSLNSLPKRQREAIYLKFYQELSSDQIAEVMALQPQSVYNLIHGALKLLKERLRKSYVLMLLLTLITWFVVR